MARSRDWRRAQRDRVIANTERWMIQYGYFDGRFSIQPNEGRDIAVRKRAATPHPCSGYCCGNPRRWASGRERLTEQEHRAPRFDD